MKKRIINGFLTLALLLGTVSGVVSCKDHDDSYAELKAQMNKTLAEALAQQKAELMALIDDINECECNIDEKLKDYATKSELSKYATEEELSAYLKSSEAAATYAKIEDLTTAKQLLEGMINEINTTMGNLGETGVEGATVAEQISTLNTLITGVLATIEELEKCNCAEQLAGLTGRVETLEGQIAGWNEQITQASMNAAAALATVNGLEARVAANEGTISSITAQVGGLETQVREALSKFDNYYTQEEINAMLNTAKEEAQTAVGEAATTAGLAMAQAGANATAIGELQTALEDVYTKEEIDTKLAAINEAIEAVKNRVSKLENLVSNILEKMVTGILIQGTQSPVIGYFNAPGGTRSRVLAAYYGEITETMEFPSTRSAAYVNAEDVNMWTDRNYDVMGLNNLGEANGYFTQSPDAFVTQKKGKVEGNAGTLYLTVNPNTVNFEGVTLDMETSQENASPITLTPLERSERELTFGYNRAAGNNGFYEAQATLTKENISAATINIDFDNLKETAKTMLKEKSKASVLNMGATLIRSVEDLLPAYGVKANWTDGNGKEHSVYSEYALATTAIKPLSYTFLKDSNFKLPGEQKLHDLVNKTIDKINIDFGIDFSKFENVSITLNRGDKDYIINVNVDVPVNQDQPVTVTVPAQTVTVDGQTIAVELQYVEKDGDGNVIATHPVTGNVEVAGKTVTIPSSTVDTIVELRFTLHTSASANINEVVDDLFNSLNGDLSKINDMLAEVSKLRNLESKITDAKNDIKSQLNGYITRIYNRLNNIINTYPNKALQPALIAMAGNKQAGMLSRTKRVPTIVYGTSITLYPTSYTLELLAPAYKKFIAVTDVLNLDGSEVELSKAKSMAAAANAGENMFKVIDSEKTCEMKAQAGYIYELTYTAVDYHGKVAIKKFYVQFK